MNVRTAGALTALAVVAVSTAWWVVRPSDLGSSTAAAVRDPTAPPPAPALEPDRLRQLSAPLPTALAQRSYKPSSDAPPALPTPPAKESGQEERIERLIGRARDTIWQRGDELGLSPADSSAAVHLVESYLVQISKLKAAVQSGTLDRALAKDQLVAEQEALRHDLDELLGPDTHEALRSAIPLKY